MKGAVIVPAHNEASVISATLAPLHALLAEGIEVLVVPNGCSDRTAELARSVPGVQVVDVAVASKAAALNAADEAAHSWPRLYLDADIVIDAATVRVVFDRLTEPGIYAARPEFEYDTSRCDAWVRAYYRARNRIPAMHDHLWGAGAYALNAAGHARFDSFPDLTADDLFVDQLFSRAEIAFVGAVPVRVRCPRTSRALLSTLRRVQRGRAEVARSGAVEAAGGPRKVLQTVVGPASLVDAVIYASFSLAARIASNKRAATWQRDETNRVMVSDTPEQVRSR